MLLNQRRIRLHMKVGVLLVFVITGILALSRVYANTIVEDYASCVKRIAGQPNSFAIKELSELIAKDFRFLDSHIMRARLYSEEHKWSEAIEDYKTLTVLQPGVYLWPLSHGRCLSNLGRFREALEYFNIAHRLCPGDVSDMRDLECCYISLGEWEKSLVWSKMGLDLAPDDKYLRIDRGYTLRRLGRNNEAIVELCAARDLLWKELSSKEQMADKVQLMGRISEELCAAHANELASDLAKALIQKFPCAESFYTLGKIRFESSEFEECLQAFTASIRCDPKLAKAYFDRGTCLMKVHRFKEAIQDYQRARCFGTPSDAVDLQSARCVFGLEDYKGAYSKCMELMKLRPSADLNILASDCLMKMDRSDRFVLAEKHLAAADAQGARSRRTNVRRATNVAIRYPAGSDEFVAAVTKLLQDHSNSPELFTLRANYFLGKKQYGKAIRDYSSAISSGCVEPSTFIVRSKLYEDALQGDKALRDAEQAVKLAPNLADAYKQRGHVYKFLIDRPDLAEKDTVRYRSLSGANERR